MSLSEEELRLLAQMESALAVDDPSLADQLSGRAYARRRRLVAVGLLGGVVAGLAVMVVAVSAAATWLGLAGFVLALWCAYSLARLIDNISPDGLPTAARGPSRHGPSRRGPAPGHLYLDKSTVMDKLAKRWSDRQQERRDFR